MSTVSSIYNGITPYLPIAAGVAGAIPSNATTTTSLPGNYQNLSQLLTQRAMQRLNTPFDTAGYTASGLSNINRAYQASQDALNANLTARGLANSPVAAAAQTKFQLGKTANQTDFLNQVPLVAQQAQDQALGAAGNVLNTAPRTTTQQAGGGLSGGIQSAAEMMAYLKGKGIFGAAGSALPSSSLFPAAGTAGYPQAATGTSWESLMPEAQGEAPGLAPAAGDIVSNLPGSIGTVAGLGDAGVASALGGAGAAGGTSLGAIAAGEVPELATLPSVGIAPTVAAPTVAGTAGGLSSLASTLGALASNPITWAVGGALAGAMIWKSTQVHPVADKFVQNYQNPFGQHLGNIVNAFDKAYQSGTMTKAQAAVAYQQTANFINQFMQDGQKFASQGDKQMQVWKQATRTMAQNFGGQAIPGGNGLYAPDWSGILGKMQQEIGGLP